MTPDAWLRAHSYLRPVADLCARVEAAVAEIETGGPPLPCWEDYESEYRAGVPLLQSPEAAIDLEPAGEMVVSLVERLASGSSSEQLTADARVLRDELSDFPGAARRVVDWLLGADDLAPASPGLLRYLGWSATSRYIRPLLDAFVGWRQDDRWQRGYCPTCGSPPSMAQLVGADPTRLRLLSCGCCRTRWRYGRTRCPYCESDSQRLAIVAVEEEAGLRIDYCESCKGYLKTYAGQGDESLLLADWSSLHLDLVACDRGLERLAGSLFELGAFASTTP